MYATVSDMSSRFKASELTQLTDEAGTGNMDEARIETALTSASTLIDSYLAAVYDLPLTTTPAILVDQACEIARYKLYGDAAPEGVKARYDDVMDWLKLVAKGTVKLDVAGAEPPPAENTILTTGQDRVFSRTSLRGY